MANALIDPAVPPVGLSEPAGLFLLAPDIRVAHICEIKPHPPSISQSFQKNFISTDRADFTDAHFQILSLLFVPRSELRILRPFIILN